MQPCINVGRLNRNDAALVLLVWRQLRVGSVHARHERVMVGVDREHGVAGNHFARFLVGPVIPQTRQSPRCAISTTEAPPNIAASLPAWLIKGPSRNDAALAL
jgi:hypothetical protein